jgi:hypothetical protein
MANRYPLILDSSNNKIKELPSGDNLDLTGAGISSVSSVSVGTAVTIGSYGVHATGVVTATSFVGDGSGLTGVANTEFIVGTAATFTSELSVAGITTADATGVNVTGVVTATTFVGALTGAVTGDATGLSGTPNITVGSVNATSGTFSGNVTIGGTLTYQDVTNIDAVGLITAQQGIQILANGINITSGIATVGLTTIKSGEIEVVGIITASTLHTDTFDTVVGGAVVTGVITATDFNATSDTAVKENIQPIENPLASIVRIDGVTFQWKESKKDSAGVTAQNLEQVLPNLVNNGELKSVNYNGLVGYLIEAVKDQQRQIDELRERLDAI